MGSIERAPRGRQQTNFVRVIVGDGPSAWMALAVVALPFLAWSQGLRKGPMEAVLLMTGGLGVALWLRVRSFTAIRRCGVTMLARIVSIDWQVSLLHNVGIEPYDAKYNRPDCADVTVRYFVNGREYTPVRRVSGYAASRMAAGADVQVLVDPKRPWRFVFEHLS